MGFWSDWSDGKKWFMGIVSALVIAAAVGALKVLWDRPDGLPEQRVEFSASSDPHFAVQSSFLGTAVVSANEIAVQVDSAKLSYHEPPSGIDAVLIDDIRVSLAEAAEGNWKPVRESSRIAITRILKKSEATDLGPFAMKIPVDGLKSLSGYWLIFAIAESTPGSPDDIGWSYAHTRRDLF